MKRLRGTTESQNTRGLALRVLIVMGLATAIDAGFAARVAAAADMAPVPPGAPSAYREPSAPGANAPPEPYSVQIVIADAAGLLAAQVASTKTNLPWPFLGGWLLPSPIVHLAHGNPGRALGSLFLHAAMPVAGFFVGLEIAGCHDNFLSEESTCSSRPAMWGLALGMLSATVIDAATLARLDAAQAPRAPPPEPGLTWIPTLTVGPRADLGLSWRGLF